MGDDEENKVKIDSDIRKSHREEKFPGQLLVEKSFPAAWVALQQLKQLSRSSPGFFPLQLLVHL